MLSTLLRITFFLQKKVVKSKVTDYLSKTDKQNYISK